MNPRRLHSATIFSISGGDAGFFSVMARADYGQSRTASQGRQAAARRPSPRGDTRSHLLCTGTLIALSGDRPVFLAAWMDAGGQLDVNSCIKSMAEKDGPCELSFSGGEME